MYGSYRHNSLARKLVFKLTIEEFKTFISRQCFYCGSPPAIRKKGITPVNGIDRVNPEKGYSMSNCVTACWICNKMKSIFKLEEFLKAVGRIYENQAGQKVQKDDKDSWCSLENKDEKIPT